MKWWEGGGGEVGSAPCNPTWLRRGFPKAAKCRGCAAAMRWGMTRGTGHPAGRCALCMHSTDWWGSRGGTTAAGSQVGRAIRGCPALRIGHICCTADVAKGRKVHRNCQASEGWKADKSCVTGRRFFRLWVPLCRIFIRTGMCRRRVFDLPTLYGTVKGFLV